MTPEQFATRLDKHLEKVTRKRGALGAPQVLVSSPALGIDYAYGERGKPFHTASIGKLPTAVLTMQQVEAGSFTLRTPITTLLPAAELERLFVVDGVDHSREVTVEHLLTHTSGAADYFEDDVISGEGFIDGMLRDRDRMWAPGELLDFTREHQVPVGRPGERFNYSDTGYILLGRILEEATGSAFHDLLTDRFFRPLGMDDSYMLFRSEPKNAPRPIAPLWIGDTEASTFTSMSIDWSGGGIITTLDDLARFTEALHRGSLLGPGSVAELTRMRNRFRQGIHYGAGTMEVRFEEFFFLLRGLPRPVGHIGLLATHLYYDAVNDAQIVMNFNSTKEMVRSFRTLVRIEQQLQRVERPAVVLAPGSLLNQ